MIEKNKDIFFKVLQLDSQWRKEDPDRDVDPYSYQNVTDPEHWLGGSVGNPDPDPDPWFWAIRIR